MRRLYGCIPYRISLHGADRIGNLSAGNSLWIGVTVLGLHLVLLNVLYPKFLGGRLRLNPVAYDCPAGLGITMGGHWASTGDSYHREYEDCVRSRRVGEAVGRVVRRERRRERAAGKGRRLGLEFPGFGEF